jgi:hypothetical protein
MSLILQELGIVVAMQQPNPNLVTADFLKLSGIIPLDWQLAREPIHGDTSQLLFTNGVRIIAEPNRIIFDENIGDRDVNTLTVATVARKYVEIFKLAKYAAIGINIRSHSPQTQIEQATAYINHQLLNSGAWQNYGTTPMRAALSLSYTLPGRELNLEITAAGIQSGESEITPVILFSGNFSYNLAELQVGESAAAASQILTDWQTDLSAYCELITDRFLTPTTVNILPATVQIDERNSAELDIPYAPNLYPLTTFS